MNKQQAVNKLRKLGFEFDWAVTGPDPVWGEWVGTIDPIKRMSLGGDECRGIVVSGDTAPEMYQNAVDEADLQSRWLEPCTDPECDYHNSE